MIDDLPSALAHLPTDRSWTRRLLTTPALYVLAAALLITLPFLLPLAAIRDVWTKSDWSICRTLLFLTYFACFEALGLIVLFWLWVRHKTGMNNDAYRAANRKMQRFWVRGLFGAVTALFSLRVEIQGIEALEKSEPAVILSRHANTLDPLLPLALSTLPTRFRYVMKSELLFDPALDYCGQRFPNVFVRRGSNNKEREIAKVVALGQHLGQDEAVVLFPEGTRFSKSKRQRLLEKFSGDEQMHAVVTSLRHTLPPLREGSVQLLANTGCDVVILAHRGLEAATDLSDLARGALTNGNLEVAIWRISADEVPRTPEAIRGFLIDQWQRIDRFVAGDTVSLEPPAAHPAKMSTPSSISDETRAVS